jgi:hypothetical protein
MARSEPSVRVSEGTIPNGTEVFVDSPYNLGRTRALALVVGYIAHTNAYLLDMGRELRAYPAEQVMRRVPKFTSIEEADAWLEGR